MPVMLERKEDYSLIRLEGECSVTSAAELKRLLLEGIAAGGSLRLDLERAEAVDISILQLLWAVGEEGKRSGTRIEIRIPDAVARTAREAGFEQFPGLAVQA